MTDDPKFKGIEIDGRRYALLGCFQCPFWHNEDAFIKCKYPHKPSECLERSEWSYPDDCPLEDAKKREATDKRWAVIKELDYTVPAGSSENIKKGVNELTLKILTTEDLKSQIKDFIDRKEGSTLRLLYALSIIAMEPKTEVNPFIIGTKIKCDSCDNTYIVGSGGTYWEVIVDSPEKENLVSAKCPKCRMKEMKE